MGAALGSLAASVVLAAQQPAAGGESPRAADDAAKGDGDAAMDRPRRPISTREVTYEVGGQTYRGFLAMPEGADADNQRPGVVVVHEWWGRNEYADERARQLAELGFVAFALDMYGGGQVVDTPERAQNLATPFYGDRAMMRRRAMAGVEQLRQLSAVNSEDIAAIGYCFGGTVVLELARAGAALDAVVAFHGGLTSPNDMSDIDFGGTILVANGAADSFVPIDERQAFIDEMEAADVDYMFIEYGGAVHSFTNPDADDLGMDNVAYDESADERSWRHMLLLFEEAFGE
jgi:dienelactone hydrolase